MNITDEMVAVASEAIARVTVRPRADIVRVAVEAVAPLIAAQALRSRPLWLAIEYDYDSAEVHAVFERREDADAYVAEFGTLEVEEVAFCGPGEQPEVRHVWHGSAEVVTRAHGHLPGLVNAVEADRPGALPCEGVPVRVWSQAHRLGARLPTTESCELVTYETRGCPKLIIGVRGTSREAVMAKVTELASR